MRVQKELSKFLDVNNFEEINEGLKFVFSSTSSLTLYLTVLSVPFSSSPCFLAVSYNQPTFCPNATWNASATTFANTSTVGSQPYDIFINTNNNVYVASRAYGEVLMWSGENITLMKTITGSLSSPYSLFVTINGDIYVDSGSSYYQVNKCALNTTVTSFATCVYSACNDLFITINDMLYCSMSNYHQVIAKPSNSVLNPFETVAGTGHSGSTASMLYSPWGIFVDVNFDLYVADSGNNRIQLFQAGQTNALTVAGNGASNTITLNNPTGVVLDANKYLYIVDSYNNRIVGSGPNGFRCIVGCAGLGSAPNQLYYPQSMAFDSYGNIFVVDRMNSRIQQFFLATNLCGMCTTHSSKTLRKLLPRKLAFTSLSITKSAPI
jgi:hypothetical protein